MLRFFPNPRENREFEEETRRVVEILDPSYETCGSWNPIKVEEKIPKKLLFVDGVRRTEFRTTIFDDNHFLGEAIFISVGVGVLKVSFDEQRANYELINPTVKRFFIYHSEENLEIPPFWETKIGNYLLKFETIKSPSRNLGKLANLQMGKLEIEAAFSSLSKDSFLIMDGPVKRNRFLKNVAYLVKEQKNIYLQGREDIVFRLKRGYRTPLFLFEEHVEGLTKNGEYKVGKVKKLACYVCLADKEGLSDPTLNLARIELPYTENGEEAIKTAEMAAAAALFFANKPLRDFRAPQNLTTIAFLEKQLRRYLGEYSLIRRKVGEIIYTTTIGS